MTTLTFESGSSKCYAGGTIRDAVFSIRYDKEAGQFLFVSQNRQNGVMDISLFIPVEEMRGILNTLDTLMVENGLQ